MTSGTTPGAPPTSEDETDYMFAAHPRESIDAAYVFGRAVELVGQRPREVIGIAAASVLLSWALLFGLLALGVLGNSLWAAAGVDDVMHPLGIIVLLVIGWAAALLLQAPLVGSAIELHSEQRGLFAVLLSRGMSRLPQLMVASAIVIAVVIAVSTVAMALIAAVVALAALIPWGVVQVMLAFVGSLVIAAYALRTIAGFSLLVPVMLVEQLEGSEALRRSWAIGWRHGFAIISALVLPALLVQAVLFPTQFMPWYIGLGMSIVLGVGLALYNTAVVPVTYVAIREFVEGLHPGRVMDVAGPSPTSTRPPARTAAKAPRRAARPAKSSRPRR
ncbi:MAG: hypothetical protein AB1Z98_31590 [Nannocystaceae bacterium]